MKIWPALFQVFGLLVSSAHLSWSQDTPSSSSGSDSASYGPTCNFDNNARCVLGAECVAPQQCICPQKPTNDGTFHCGDPAEQNVELLGQENTLQSWNNSLSAPFPFPCRIRITEFVTERPTDQLRCTFQVFGENKVIGERVLVVAMELHVKVEEAGSLRYEKGIRLSQGSLEQNTYHYEERTKDTFSEEMPETFTELPDDSDLINSGSGMGDFLDNENDDEDMDNPSEDDEDAGQQWSSPNDLGPSSTQDDLLSKEVDANSVAILGIPECGLEFRFRAADSDLMENNLQPGLAVLINPEIDNIQYSQPNSYIAGHPLSDINHSLRQEFQLAQTEIFLHTSLQFSAVQGESTEGELCKDVGFVYRSYCNTKQKKMAALKKCSPLVTDGTTQTCLDTSQRDHGGALQVFKRCLWIECSPTPSVCKTLKSELSGDTCLDTQMKLSILSRCPNPENN